MFRWKIRLETLTDATNFLAAVSQVPDEEVYIRSGAHLCTSAKSALGCHMAAIEWNNLLCECNADIYTKISKFIVEETPETKDNW